MLQVKMPVIGDGTEPVDITVTQEPLTLDQLAAASAEADRIRNLGEISIAEREKNLQQNLNDLAVTNQKSDREKALEEMLRASQEETARAQRALRVKSNADANYEAIQARSEMPIEYAPEIPLVTYRHKTISRFEVDRFVFKDHIMQIPATDVEEFESIWQGLHGSDKVNIVKVRDVLAEQAIARREKTGGAYRGLASTDRITDPTKNAPLPSGIRVTDQ